MAPGIARAPGQKYPGRRLSGVATDGTTDAQEVDVPTHDEQRVRNTHCSSITCRDLECPVNVRHVDGAQRHIRRHDGGNMRVRAAIPAPCCSRCCSRRPARGAAGAVSALPDPAERRLGLRRRLMLAVAPGAAGALLVVALPARDADHALYCAAFVLALGTAKRLRPINGAAALKVDVVVWPQARTRSCEQDLRPRSRAACDGDARPNAHPRSGRPRCRISPAARRRNSGIQAVPGKQRRPPWPCAP